MRNGRVGGGKMGWVVATVVATGRGFGGGGGVGELREATCSTSVCSSWFITSCLES